MISERKSLILSVSWRSKPMTIEDNVINASYINRRSCVQNNNLLELVVVWEDFLSAGDGNVTCSVLCMGEKIKSPSSSDESATL